MTSPYSKLYIIIRWNRLKVYCFRHRVEPIECEAGEQRFVFVRRPTRGQNVEQTVKGLGIGNCPSLRP